MAQLLALGSNIFIFVVSAWLLFILTRVLERHALAEKVARSEPSFNLEIAVRYLRERSCKTQVLELRVKTINNSTRICCVLAAYVEIRPLQLAGVERAQFDDLPRCGELSL